MARVSRKEKCPDCGNKTERRKAGNRKNGTQRFKWRCITCHPKRKSQKDSCSKCGGATTLCRSGKNPDGTQKYQWICGPCTSAKNMSEHDDRRGPSQKDNCTKCGTPTEYRLSGVNKSTDKPHGQWICVPCKSIKNHKRRALDASASGSFTITEWNEVKESQHFRCLDCGLESKLTVGHLVPLCRGGSNYISNIAAQCLSCNCKQGKNVHSSIEVAA